MVPSNFDMSGICTNTISVRGSARRTGERAVAEAACPWADTKGDQSRISALGVGCQGLTLLEVPALRLPWADMAVDALLAEIADHPFLVDGPRISMQPLRHEVVALTALDASAGRVFRRSCDPLEVSVAQHVIVRVYAVGAVPAAPIQVERGTWAGIVCVGG